MRIHHVIARALTQRDDSGARKGCEERSPFNLMLIHARPIGLALEYGRQPVRILFPDREFLSPRCKSRRATGRAAHRGEALEQYAARIAKGPVSALRNGVAVARHGVVQHPSGINRFSSARSPIRFELEIFDALAKRLRRSNKRFDYRKPASKPSACGGTVSSREHQREWFLFAFDHARKISAPSCRRARELSRRNNFLPAPGEVFAGETFDTASLVAAGSST